MIRTFLFASICCFSASASATVIWADNFESTPGSAPNIDYPGGAAGNDWSVSNPADGPVTSVTSLSGGKSLFQTDNHTTSTVATVATSQFAPFSLNATNNIMRISFDFRVDSLLSTSATVGPRMIFRSGTTVSNGYVLGFSRATTDLNADGTSGDLNFYVAPQGAGTSSVGGGSAGGTYIGLNGGAWANGFDFGEYSATSADNNTDGHFYRFQVDYNFNTGAVTGIATNVDDPTQTTTFSILINSGIAFSATDAAMLFATGSNTGVNNISGSDNYFDNIVVEIIPEPSSALLAGGGLALLASRRRRRD